MRLVKLLMPSFENEDTNLRARLLYFALFTFVLYTIVTVLISLFVHPDPSSLFISGAFLIALCSFIYFLTRKGKTTIAAALFVAFLLVFFIFVGFFNGGLKGGGAFNYIIVVTLAGLLFGAWIGISVAATCILAAVFMVVAEINGTLPVVTLPTTTWSLWSTFLISLLLSASYLGLSRRDARNALKRARNSENELFQKNEELKATQEQLLHAQKMEAVGQLAGGVAHDFNNLLTAIGGYASLIGMKLGSREGVQTDLEEIKTAVERGSRLTAQLLAFSRKQVVQPQVLNINDVILSMETMLRRLIGEDITMDTVLFPGLYQVMADSGQMDQVLLNLTLNARDAMPRGGNLTIETSNTALGEEYVRNHPEAAAGDYMMMAVSDSGEGISREVQARIFEPFFTTKKQGKGLGLGLSTVYGIVKQSQGHTAVYSEPGKGTTIKVYLPRTDTSQKASVENDTAHFSFRGTETVLVVEDEPALLSLIHQVLEQRGYTVLTAGNGNEALRQSELHKGPIDLLVTDVIIPGGMSGPELVTELMKTRHDVEVLYISGYTDNAIVHRGMIDPGVNFLQKPFSTEQFGRIIRELLDSKSDRHD